MEVRTTRFGVLSISDDRIIHIPKGLLGFSQFTRYALLEPGADAAFFWLQCVDEPSLAFVVTDPSLFVSDYSVPIRPEQMGDLGLAKLEDAQVFVIVNKVGEQMVLAEKRWTTRHPMVRVGATNAPAHAMSA